MTSSDTPHEEPTPPRELDLDPPDGNDNWRSQPRDEQGNFITDPRRPGRRQVAHEPRPGLGARGTGATPHDAAARWRALEQLAGGANVTDAAAASGVPRRTLTRWLHRDDAFKDQLAELQAQVRAHSRRVIRGVVDEAARVVVELMRFRPAGDDKVAVDRDRLRLLAAQDILDRIHGKATNKTAASEGDAPPLTITFVHPAAAMIAGTSPAASSDDGPAAGRELPPPTPHPDPDRAAEIVDPAPPSEPGVDDGAPHISEVRAREADAIEGEGEYVDY